MPKLATQPLKRPVLIRGDLLPQFLESALPSLLEQKPGNGVWLSQSDLGAAQRVAPLEADSEQCETPPLLPTHFRFQPLSKAERPLNAWLALAHDAHRHVLWCHGSKGYGAFTIAGPLYRQFGQLGFCGPDYLSLVKGSRFLMPSAILSPKNATQEIG